MIDESLPTADSTDSEPKPNDRDETPNCDATDRSATDRDAIDPSREPAATDREPREEPDRATDPPPDRIDGDAACECDPEPDGGDDESDGTDGREYRLERLRLWRTVVTLAVVVARLIRSL
ncbi:hypothetical protein [Halorubrum sp. AS12]|uniref:hypothetical protein n=1 Tax=Halorubrum sp. AS12 TaxID=3409687 RepID=UPI003DA74A7B